MGRRVPVLYLLLLALVPGVTGQEPVRLATYNVEALGAFGSNEWNRAVSSIARMGAQVVAVQEIANIAEAAVFPTFAAAAGLPNAVVSGTSGTLSGGLRNGVMSVHPIVFTVSHTAASLSGDPNANDITRDILEVHVQVPNAGDVLGVFVVHLKSGSGSTNDFRRAVEVLRVEQAIAAFTATRPGAPWVLLGDFNEDLADGPFGNVFFSVPGGVPSSYSLGADVTFPVVYDPFATFLGQGALIADATQEDTTNVHATREMSGRRLDYVLYAQGTLLAGDEVYNSARDDGIDDPPPGNWLAKVGAPLPATWSLEASDHYPVFGDFTVPSLGVLFPGSGEDFVMATGTAGGGITTGPGFDVKQLGAGDFLAVHYVSPQGTFDGTPPAIVGQFFPPSGQPPVGPWPHMWFDLTAFALFNGLAMPGGFSAAVAPVTGNVHVYLVPPGLEGTSVMVQSLAVSPLAMNGFFPLTDGHRLDFVFP